MNQIPLSPRGRRLLPMIVLPLLLAAGACSDAGASDAADTTDTDTETETTEPAASDVEFLDQTGQAAVEIQVRDNSFVGQFVSVSAGTTVTFDNRGRNPHNAEPVEAGAFDGVATDALQPGQAATVVFEEPGEYPYYCTLHGTETAGMFGTIRVE